MSAQRPRLSIDVSPEINELVYVLALEESRKQKRRVTMKQIVMQALRSYLREQGTLIDHSAFNAEPVESVKTDRRYCVRCGKEYGVIHTCEPTAPEGA